ncbi:MAG: 30S ribosomal protein S7 [Planctomycetes bacterium]|nr:30S ribosomal protein S7 [Planctomycetota bacterium]
MPPGRFRKFKKKTEKTKFKFKFKSTERFLKPEPRYNDVVLAKLINQVMYDGKKTVAQGVVYGAMDIIAERIKEVPPLDVVVKAINNVKPQVEVRSKRVGGATYQVPMEVNRKRQQTLAIRNIILNARSKKGKPMARRLAEEIIDAYNNQGASIAWKENTHKMAEANKLFAHFAW